MIDLSPEALSQSARLSKSYIPTLEYKGIGPYKDFMYSSKLESWDWEGASSLSRKEFYTLLTVRTQFLPKTDMSDSGLKAFMHLREMEPNPDLYDAFYEAYDEDIEWSQQYFPNTDPLPYTKESIRRTFSPDGVSVSVTYPKFSDAPDEFKDQYILEEIYLMYIRDQVIPSHTYNKGRPFDFMSVIDQIHDLVRSHPDYQLRKWATMYQDRIARNHGNIAPYQVLVHNRRFLEYTS